MIWLSKPVEPPVVPQLHRLAKKAALLIYRLRSDIPPLSDYLCSVKRLAPKPANSRTDQGASQTYALGGRVHPEQTDLPGSHINFLACHVAGGASLPFGYEHHTGAVSAALIEPCFVQAITRFHREVPVKIEPRIPIAVAGNGSQEVKVGGLDRADRRTLRHTRRLLE